MAAAIRPNSTGTSSS